MSFIYGDLGNYLQCSCDGKSILVKRNSGEIRRYPTTLTRKIDWQCNPFNSVGIMFLLYDGDSMIIGRKNGIMSEYAIEDNLLLNMYKWTPPSNPGLKEIGTAYYDVMSQIMLDLSDMRTCYISKTRDEYIFNEPYTKLTINSEALSKAMNNIKGFHVTPLHGKEVDVNADGHWAVQNRKELGDIRELI